MTKAEKRLRELTKEIDERTAEWVDLGEDIEGLIEARLRYAKRYKLPLPKEEDDGDDTKSSDGRGRSADVDGISRTQRASA